jgi:hypothetical protein
MFKGIPSALKKQGRKEREFLFQGGRGDCRFQKVISFHDDRVKGRKVN